MRTYVSRKGLRLPTRDTDLAYLAATIDSEGHIQNLVNHPRPSVRNRVTVSIATTEEVLIEWLRQIGGAVYPEKLGALGRKPSWKWQVGARDDVIELLQAVLPYMLVKRAKAESALAFAIERKS